ncbi:MAG: tyrosine-type recombinase/integrase [Thermoguttaceae bacterium]
MRTTAIPFDRFRDELLRLYDPPHRATVTRRQVAQVLREVGALEVKTTADLTPALVARYVESRPPGQSPRTLHAMLRVLRGICNQAVITGVLRVSPFAARRVSSWVGRLGPPTEKKHYSRDEIRRVLTLMVQDVETTAGWAQWRARRIYALTAVVAYTGVRGVSEAQYLHAADIHLKERFIALTDRGRDGGRRLKTEGSEQPVPIPDALVPILQDWLDHRLDRPADSPIPDCPWLFPNISGTSNWRGGSPGTKPLDRLQDVAKRAGVDGGMTFLSLRHSWATHAEYHGYGPALIQRVLRHTTEQTAAKWYRHADLPNLIERCAGFDF